MASLPLQLEQVMVNKLQTKQYLLKSAQLMMLQELI